VATGRADLRILHVSVAFLPIQGCFADACNRIGKPAIGAVRGRRWIFRRAAEPINDYCLKKRGLNMSSKDDMVELVAKTTGCTKTSARDAVNKIFDSIMAQCRQSGEIQIPGFGKFSVRQRAARMGRNPRTGQTIQIRASKTVGFKPAATFKGSL
jgi:DNA-binding protein HU-beta